MRSICGSLFLSVAPKQVIISPDVPMLLEEGKTGCGIHPTTKSVFCHAPGGHGKTRSCIARLSGQERGSLHSWRMG